MKRSSEVRKMPAKAPRFSGLVLEKFQKTRKEIRSALVEMDEEIIIALVAMICQYHVLFVGMPGIAKSMLAKILADWMGKTKPKTLHFCKDTSRNVAFGPIKLSALKEDRIDRVFEGGVADAIFVVFEEVYKAGPAVLDMFLMFMNERVIEEGQISRKCPVRFIMGVSNEWSPEGCETALAAFFDRFLFRREVKPVQSYSGLRKLCGIPTDDPDEEDPHNCEPELTTELSLEELDEANKAANSLIWTVEARDTFFRIHEELVKEGIVPGPRRLKQSVKACQAYAWLNGEEKVNPESLEILKHILWMDPIEQPGKCAKIVEKLANPLVHEINRYEDLAEEIYEGFVKVADATTGNITELCTNNIAKLEDVLGKVKVLSAHHRRDELLEEINQYKGKIYKRKIVSSEKSK